jgi:hypothetical protein
VPYDVVDMQNIEADIDRQIDLDCYKYLSLDCECLSVRSIEKLMLKLKAGKYDGNNGIVSDCLLHGSHKLFVFLGLLFKMMIVHSYVPQDLLVGTMFPLPKIKGFTTASEKYRAITLSGCVLKVFDLLVLSEERLSLQTDDLQFGFKKPVQPHYAPWHSRKFVLIEKVKFTHSYWMPQRPLTGSTMLSSSGYSLTGELIQCLSDCCFSCIQIRN